MHFHAGRIAVLTLLAAVFLSVPLTWVDHGPSWCLIKAVSGHECPGCGMTRALVHASRGDLAAAWEYNWRWVLVAPLLVFLSVRWALATPRVAGLHRANDVSTMPHARSGESMS